MSVSGSDRAQKILESVGGFGLYQQVMCFGMLTMTTGLCALSLASQHFSLLTPDHWCFDTNVAALQQQLPLLPEDAKKFSIPPASTNGRPLLLGRRSVEASLTFSQCERYDGDLVASYIAWVAAKRPASLALPRTRKRCDQGWVYNTSGLMYTMPTQFDWVCDNKWKAYVIEVGFWIATAIGGSLLGFASSRYGSRPVLLAGVGLCFLGNGLTMVHPEFITIFTARVVAGFAHLTVKYLPLFLVLDITRKNVHSLLFLIVFLNRTLFSLLVSWAVLALHSWWWLFLMPVSSATICLLLTWRFLPESPWWLCSKKRYDDALEVLQRIASTNGKRPLSLTATALRDSAVLHRILEEPQHRRLYDCCTDRRVSGRFRLLEPRQLSDTLCAKHKVILNVVWMLVSMCYYGGDLQSTETLSVASDTRGGTVLTSYWYSALMEVPCWGLPVVLHQSRGSGGLGYRCVLVTTLIITAVLGAGYAIIPRGNVLINLGMLLVIKMLATAAYYTIYQKVYELQHDVIEVAQSESLSALMISMAPFVIYLGEYNNRLPSLIFGTVAVLGAIVSLFLPEYTTMLSNETEQIDNLTQCKASFKKWMTTTPSTTISSAGAAAKRNPSTEESSLPYNALEIT